MNMKNYTFTAMRMALLFVVVSIIALPVIVPRAFSQIPGVYNPPQANAGGDNNNNNNNNNPPIAKHRNGPPPPPLPSHSIFGRTHSSYPLSQPPIPLSPAPVRHHPARMAQPVPVNSNSGNNNSKALKAIILNFDDGYQSQFQYAKPILDQYNYKASFFLPCQKIESDPKWMTWDEITQLHEDDGMDIQSHTMTHAHLTDFLSGSAEDNLRLHIEIAGSKACLAEHGFTSNILGYPLNLGGQDPRIVGLVSKSYVFARAGGDDLFFLDCKHYVAHPPQPDCRLTHNGNLTYANQYDIRANSFSNTHKGVLYSPDAALQYLIKRVNKQVQYNTDQTLEAIPIVTFHNLTYNMTEYNQQASVATVPLFEAFIKYLHDNNFHVISMHDLRFDTVNNIFFIDTP